MDSGLIQVEREPEMQIVMNSLGLLRRFGQKAGPYVMLEMLLPGGTLLALLLFLYRRRKPDIQNVASRIALALTRALTSMVEPSMFVPRPAVARVNDRSLSALEAGRPQRSGRPSTCVAAGFGYRDVESRSRRSTIG